MMFVPSKCCSGNMNSAMDLCIQSGVFVKLRVVVDVSHARAR